MMSFCFRRTKKRKRFTRMNKINHQKIKIKIEILKQKKKRLLKKLNLKLRKKIVKVINFITYRN
jgi:hypothetical protein